MDTVQDVRKEHADILSDGHAGNHLLDGIDLDVLFGGVKFQSQFVHLTLLLSGEEAGVVRVSPAVAFLSFRHFAIIVDHRIVQMI